MTKSSKPQIFVNGKKTSSDRIFKSPFQEDQILIFESLKSYRGVIFRLEEHLDRLFESANTTGLEITKTREELKKELKNCLSQAPAADLFLRLMVDGKNSYIFLLKRNRPPAIYEEGVDLKTAVQCRHLSRAELSEAKTNAFLNNVLAAMEPKTSEIYESIFLDPAGYVSEATIWNIFLVKEGILRTPGAAGVLRGVTRQFVIECAVKEHLPVQETNLTRHEFWNADEAFLTNTSGEIVPIRSLDGRKIGSKIPGAVTKRLMTRFQKEVEKELANENQTRTHQRLR